MMPLPGLGDVYARRQARADAEQEREDALDAATWEAVERVLQILRTDGSVEAMAIVSFIENETLQWRCRHAPNGAYHVTSVSDAVALCVRDAIEESYRTDCGWAP